MTTLYGIANCDTVRKARNWLTDHGVDYQFHDFRKDGLSTKQLKHWVEVVGWEALLNRRSQTWRKLPAKARDDLTAANAIKLMQAEPTLIKRPVLEMKSSVYIGFKETDYQNLFA